VTSTATPTRDFLPLAAAQPRLLAAHERLVDLDRPR
jgi:hypothetical protein